MHSSDPIRIMLVEDHPLFRQGLNIIIASQSDMQVVAQAGTSLEVVRRVPSSPQTRYHAYGSTTSWTDRTSALVAIREGSSPPRERLGVDHVGR